jgi:hypothetical protein
MKTEGALLDVTGDFARRINQRAPLMQTKCFGIHPDMLQLIVIGLT